MSEDEARSALVRVGKEGCDFSPSDLRNACQLLGIDVTSDVDQARTALTDQNRWLTKVIFAIVKLKQATETTIEIQDDFILLKSRINSSSDFVAKNLRSSIADR